MNKYKFTTAKRYSGQEEKKNNIAFQTIIFIRDKLFNTHNPTALKKIIIGKQGEMIKKIGIESRKDLEKLLGKNVYLELFVKTVKKWREKEKYLSEFGFKDF